VELKPESLAHPPHGIVDEAAEFLDAYLALLTLEEIKERARRRDWLLQVLEEREGASGIHDHQTSRMMRSRSSYFADVLDKEGIAAIKVQLGRQYFS
jgi:hypothetical protein